MLPLRVVEWELDTINLGSIPKGFTQHLRVGLRHLEVRIKIMETRYKVHVLILKIQAHLHVVVFYEMVIHEHIVLLEFNYLKKKFNIANYCAILSYVSGRDGVLCRSETKPPPLIKFHLYNSISTKWGYKDNFFPNTYQEITEELYITSNVTKLSLEKHI